MAKNSLRDRFTKGALKGKVQESYNTRDDRGGGSKDFFDPSKMEGIEKWWPKDGDHIIDVIPYLAGDNDPKTKKGYPLYFLDIWVHRRVGPTEAQVICPAVNYGEPCPICEEKNRRNAARMDYETMIKPLKPSRRSVYNVIVRDGGKEEKKGVQVMEIAHYYMEKHLSAQARSIRTGEFIVFSDPNVGRSVCFTKATDSSGNVTIDGHRFEERPEVISEEELESAYSLDDLIKRHTEEEIKNLFFAKSAPPENEEDEAPPPPRRRQPVEDEGEEEETPPPRKRKVVEEEEETPPPRKRKVVEEEEETPTPPRKKKVVVEEEEEEETPPKKKSKCPVGGKFGVDCDDLDECRTCRVYDDCAEQSYGS